MYGVQSKTIKKPGKSFSDFRLCIFGLGFFCIFFHGSGEILFLGFEAAAFRFGVFHQRSEDGAIKMAHVFPPVPADGQRLLFGNNGNADFHKDVTIVVVQSAFYQKIVVDFREIIGGNGVFRTDALAVFLHISIDFVFGVFGNVVQKVIDDFVAFVSEGIACVVLLP